MLPGVEALLVCVGRFPQRVCPPQCKEASPWWHPVVPQAANGGRNSAKNSKFCHVDIGVRAPPSDTTENGGLNNRRLILECLLIAASCSRSQYVGQSQISLSCRPQLLPLCETNNILRTHRSTARSLSWPAIAKFEIISVVSVQSVLAFAYKKRVWPVGQCGWMTVLRVAVWVLREKKLSL